jgi:hypothetical protein
LIATAAAGVDWIAAVDLAIAAIAADSVVVAAAGTFLVAPIAVVPMLKHEKKHKWDFDVQSSE